MNEPNQNPQPLQPQLRDVFAKQLTTKKKRSGWKTALKVVGGVLLVAGVGVGAWMTLTKPGREVRDNVFQVAQLGYTVHTNPNLLFDRANSNIVNILLIGRDTNWKETKIFDKQRGKMVRWHVPDDSANARSDTMIVVSLNKDTGNVNMVSIPRDSIVRIPEHGREKLNAAHSYGGPQLLIKTLHDELGLTIHHYAVIKFDGFKKLIDRMDGVYVKVDGALMKDRNGKLIRGRLKYDDNYGNLHVDLQPGWQYLDGDKAHGYIRFREDREGDPGRIRRQQQVMRALAKGLMSQPMKIPDLITEIKKQFKTDPAFSEDEMAAAGWFARNAGAGGEGKISPLTLFAAANKDGSLTLNRPKNEKLLSYIFGPTFNPNNFLVRSPETKRDDLGPTNNASPQALAILRAAGVLDPNEDAPRSPILEAPVKGARAPELSADAGSASPNDANSDDVAAAPGIVPPHDATSGAVPGDAPSSDSSRLAAVPSTNDESAPVTPRRRRHRRARASIPASTRDSSRDASVSPASSAGSASDDSGTTTRPRRARRHTTRSAGNESASANSPSTVPEAPRANEPDDAPLPVQ